MITSLEGCRIPQDSLNRAIWFRGMSHQVVPFSASHSKKRERENARKPLSSWKEVRSSFSAVFVKRGAIGDSPLVNFSRHFLIARQKVIKEVNFQESKHKTTSYSFFCL